MANPVDSDKNPSQKGLTECNKNNGKDEDSDEDNSQPPPRASFSMAYALNMLRRRQETQQATQQDYEEERKEKAKAKRKRRRQNQKLAKAKARAQVRTNENTTPITSDLQDNNGSTDLGDDGYDDKQSNQEEKRQRDPKDGVADEVESTSPSAPIPSNHSRGLKRACDDGDGDKQLLRPTKKRKKRPKLKVPKDSHGSDADDHNLKQTDDAISLNRPPQVNKLNLLLIPRALMVRREPATNTKPTIDPQ